MWERFLRWPHHYLPPPSSRRSICRADSEPDRTTLQLLSIISWRGCSYNLAIVSRATLLSPPSSASLLVQPPHYPVLSPAFSPLSSLFPPLPSPFHARNLGKQSKRRSRERERIGGTGKDIVETRWRERGTVTMARCRAPQRRREKPVFSPTDENPRSGLLSFWDWRGRALRCGAR